MSRFNWRRRCNRLPFLLFFLCWCFRVICSPLVEDWTILIGSFFAEIFSSAGISASDVDDSLLVEN